MSESKWSTVVLPHARSPRFRRHCQACGTEPCHGVTRLRVGLLDGVGREPGLRIRDPDEVPMCAWCRWKPALRLPAFLVIVVGFAWAAVKSGVPSKQWVAPDWATWLGRTPLSACFAGVFLLTMYAAFSRLTVGVQVLADRSGVRWSFREREVAVAFAADNGVTIEGTPLPDSARDEHDPDGVDHTGLRGDTPDAGD